MKARSRVLAWDIFERPYVTMMDMATALWGGGDGPEFECQVVSHYLNEFRYFLAENGIELHRSSGRWWVDPRDKQRLGELLVEEFLNEAWPKHMATSQRSTQRGQAHGSSRVQANPG